MGDYEHTTGPYGVTITIGSHTFRTDPQNPRFLVELANDYYDQDNFVFHSYNNLLTGGSGLVVEVISFQLDDPTHTVLSVDGDAGPQGPAGEIGPQGPAGPSGAQGVGLFPGALVMVTSGAPAPSGGYVLVGSYKMTPKTGSPALSVDVYRKQ